MFGYNGRHVETEGIEAACADFPQVQTRCELTPADGSMWTGSAAEGHLYSPFVTLSVTRSVQSGEETEVCLKISKL
jgi:hypothetical protein